jgi:hypothetical protein
MSRPITQRIRDERRIAAEKRNAAHRDLTEGDRLEKAKDRKSIHDPAIGQGSAKECARIVSLLEDS